MKMNKYIIIALTLLACSLSFAQKGKIRRATQDYDKYSYVKASEILLEVAEKGYKSADLFQKLGNSFYLNNKMEDASKWYGELMALNETVDAEYYYRYAQALKATENYEESNKWMNKFAETNTEDLRGKAFLSSVDYLAKIDAASQELEVVNLPLNSEVSDFGTTQYKDQLIFASSRGTGKKYKWNEQPFLDLYTATKQDDSIYANETSFSNVINTKFHESTASFTSDDKIMFFTRNNYFKKKTKRDDAGVNRLQLFRARLMENDTWGNVESIHFNNSDYSVAHPAVNILSTKIYFASDMPGTKGQSDLYVADINEDGSLGEPINLGEMLNTEAQETFPYMNSKGDLFFSSNGYPGLGGLDVFVIRDFENKYKNKEEFVVESLGKPINSPQDDFGYYENLGSNEGFFTSNREGGKGDDDIYSFKEIPCEQLVEGIIKDINSLELLPLATAILLDAEGNELQRITVGDDAAFSFALECDTDYVVRGEKEGYTPDNKEFKTPTKTQELKLELGLEKDEFVLEPGVDLAKVLGIPIIYFDFDKHNIRYDAEVELQKVLAVMQKYPKMVIDIRSHTDCRGSYAYNENLSGNRAKSTRQYLIDKGIPANRLTAMGYGEKELVNDCACEGAVKASCSEDDHQLNRRSEFIIIAM